MMRIVYELDAGYVCVVADEVSGEYVTARSPDASDATMERLEKELLAKLNRQLSTNKLYTRYKGIRGKVVLGVMPLANGNLVVRTARGDVMTLNTDEQLALRRALREHVSRDEDEEPS
jgi:hypothetical protein